MIKAINLTKIYNKDKSNECKALNGVDLQIESGESVAIIGKSGSGKSTLMNLLCGIDIASSGSITVDEIDITKLKDSKLASFRAKNIGLILQEFCLIDECTVLDNVLLPLDFIKMPNKERLSKAKAILKMVGLGHYFKKEVKLLSGGEKQRVAIARALVTGAKYIFCDEPTGSLDSKTSNDIVKLLLSLNINQVTLIIITHDINVAKQCRRIIEIADGIIINDDKIRLDDDK